MTQCELKSNVPKNSSILLFKKGMSICCWINTQTVTIDSISIKNQQQIHTVTLLRTDSPSLPVHFKNAYSEYLICDTQSRCRIFNATWLKHRKNNDNVFFLCSLCHTIYTVKRLVPAWITSSDDGCCVCVYAWTTNTQRGEWVAAVAALSPVVWCLLREHQRQRLMYMQHTYSALSVVVLIRTHAMYIF